MSAFHEDSTMWVDGEYIIWRDATTHIMSHVVHYGSSVFEGIRCYAGSNGPVIFRLREHVRRMFRSAKIYRMEIPYSEDELVEVCRNVIARNDYNEAYIRPVAFRGYGVLGVDSRKCPVVVAIGAWPWGQYLGEDALEKGVDVCFSSWRKISSTSLPPMSKAGGNYLNSQLVKMEARINGYEEGLLLDEQGYVSEGSGENIFVVLDNKVITPPFSAAVLPGITRDSILILAKELGYEVSEAFIPRELLYLADEVFLSGTAAEITPVRSIDRISIGAGKPGPVTRQIQDAFFDIIQGKAEDKYNWLFLVKQ